MPLPQLPDDREGLLRLAAEIERTLQATADDSDDATLYAHANGLYELGRIRRRLGELREAERAFDQAAAAYLKLDTPETREFAAKTKVRQASAAAKNGRYKQAFDVLEDVINQSGGVAYAEYPEVRATRLDLWLVLLGKVKAKDHERLYQASGAALDLLDPTEPSPITRGVLARTLIRRGESAQHLGYDDEAVAMYQRAIEHADGDDSFVTGTYLDRAVPELASLLDDLGRKDEALVAYRRSRDRFRNRKPLWARLRFVSARLWLWSEK